MSQDPISWHRIRSSSGMRISSYRWGNHLAELLKCLHLPNDNLVAKYHAKTEGRVLRGVVLYTLGVG